MWRIQKNLSTGKFELTQDDMTVLELTLQEIDEIASALENRVIRINPAGYRAVRNV
jgi:hypothetical protein